MVLASIEVERTASVAPESATGPEGTMTVSETERTAMRRALELAAGPDVPLGPNPRVGCVVLDAAGHTVAEGYHRGAGSPHAEVEALVRAGSEARGATVVVTLEPCNHTGRTGPCAQALVSAGVRRVVLAQRDLNPVAVGGAETLRAAGVEVETGVLAAEARELNRVWTFAVEHARPFVTWKVATTLDGRVAATDGSSRWVSSPASRLDTHALRSICDTMLVGSGTVAIDDPHLTARDAAGRLLSRQPLRAVMGERDLDPGRRVFDDAAETVHLRTREPETALKQLFARDRQHVLLEGGPTLAAAFVAAGLVDEVVAYLAPMLLGTGRAAIGELGITSISDALHLPVTDVVVLDALNAGDDVNVRITMSRPSSTVEPAQPEGNA
ncbi:MAG TPA: bifunctional diaminohydroxyphosphoribosylaminopyrimidine deaminase/5-amino-6-(5-phosphoribosylamino)uracil reductase RibD [Nocardioides sp.]|uniref:bifunctional diaminohydroxyphosphoribosylaminopyrimidine deaminase/5-amino-6-(5-phosphoribosylamino)uracil reductase RibD n=1 Tax=Nocardioides sp. TaxID=35761 RepID=UPI002E33C2E1|nr:bifunctional diaminohydroxyphosphoribosylaminopyrimidine deaminase/5-amino-6-(5-phosphoribosylamino)uracil reductase RibD [Nocardioides sp.]HEX3932070.1 bifunctional diaminohydroxyphosphoribosylaminopyrimidine deaminase/5-amino-6-(5-phosphoribosylamino)uracil reductase RibD [Nocardioides sp.]